MTNGNDEKEIREHFEGQPIGEAPLSVNVTGYKDGFRVQITRRYTHEELQLTVALSDQDPIGNAVAESLRTVKAMQDAGMEPSWNDDTNAKQETKQDPIMNVTADHTAPPAPPMTKTCATCSGTRTLKKGVSKSGKPWAGWFCESGCEVEWTSPKG